MRLLHAAISLSLAAGALSASAAAQAKKKPPPTELNADVGFVNVAGNTSLTSLSTNERFIRRLRSWEFRQDFGSVYGKTEGRESSNLWRASLRSDYVLATHWALYALTAYDRDKFAGISSRFAEGLGAVARVIATDVDQLNLESGVQLTQQKDLAGASDSFTSLRGATSWKHVFRANAYFFQALEVLPNLEESDDVRVNSETSVVAPLSEHLGIKLSYVVRYDNLPALNSLGDRLRKTDRIFSSGLQVSF